MRFLRLFLVIIIGGAWASAQDSDFKLSVDARSVSINVNVVDSTGRPVTKLTRDDFSIFEDGVPQEIQTFESVEIPYNILILVDCSSSTEADWPLMGDAVDRFASKLRATDNISVAQFGTRIETLMNWQGFTGDSLRVNIQANAKTCGGTDVYGALEGSIARFTGITGRKGVVVLTDGMQNSFPKQKMVVEGQIMDRIANSVDDKDFLKVLNDVSKSDVVFYFVAVNTDLNPDQIGHGPGQRRSGGGIYDPALIYNMQQARSRMQQIATAAGGRVVFPKKPEDVAPFYEEIARDFGTYYGLWYSPKKPADSNDLNPRKIEVRVRTPGLQVRQTRDSYTPSTR
jgi:Ca-activated chloride channel family protein